MLPKADRDTRLTSSERVDVLIAATAFSHDIRTTLVKSTVRRWTAQHGSAKASHMLDVANPLMIVVTALTLVVVIAGCWLALTSENHWPGAFIVFAVIGLRGAAFVVTERRNGRGTRQAVARSVRPTITP